jgi:hypothetical protein
MDLRALTAAAVRFFALYILLGCIDAVGEIAALLTLPKEMSGGGMQYLMVASLVVSLLAAGVLLARTQLVTGWLLRGQPAGDERVTFTGHDLALVAFSLAGLIFLVSGLENILQQVFGWYFVPHRIPTGPVSVLWSRIVGSVVKVVAGLWLLLGSGRRARAETGGISGSAPRS